MSRVHKPAPEEVEHLLRNAELRDALEPYLDESISQIDTAVLSTPEENTYLESLLVWELAPAIPVSEWFNPPLALPAPETLDDQDLHFILWDTIYKLYAERIVLDFTDHLTDRELYRIVRNKILPEREKKLDLPGNYLHWDCADVGGHPEIWLRYYANDEERRTWQETTDRPLPASETAPYQRRMPRPPT
jgi:hypothetical protein